MCLAQNKLAVNTCWMNEWMIFSDLIKGDIRNKLMSWDEGYKLNTGRTYWGWGSLNIIQGDYFVAGWVLLGLGVAKFYFDTQCTKYICRRERGGEELAFLVPCCFMRRGIIGCDSLRPGAVGSWQKAFSQSTKQRGGRGVTAKATRFFSVHVFSRGAGICVQQGNLLISGNILKHQ